MSFDREAPSCDAVCSMGDAFCQPKLTVTDVKIVTSVLEENLFYALLKINLASIKDVPTKLKLAKYGYLQNRKKGPVRKETIYTVHEHNWTDTRITSHSLSGSSVIIDAVGVTSSCTRSKKNQFRFFADIGKRAFSAPVLAWSDNTLLGMVSCGEDCSSGDTPSYATDMKDIMADLKAKQIMIKDMIAPRMG